MIEEVFYGKDARGRRYLKLAWGWTNAGLEALNKGDFDRVILGDGDWPDLEPLARYSPGCTALRLGSTLADFGSLKGLERLRGLEEFETDAKIIKKSFDFSCFPKLRELALWSWAKPYKNIFRPTLTSLFLKSYGGSKDLLELYQCPELRSLNLIGGSVSSLEGLEACQKLERIRLADLRKLTDISIVDKLPLITMCDLEGFPLIPNSVVEAMVLRKDVVRHPPQ